MAQNLVFTQSHHNDIVSKIEAYGNHYDPDFRCQGLRDIVSICSQLQGLFPNQSQDILAKHLALACRDPAGDVSIFALKSIPLLLPHFSNDVVIAKLLKAIIDLVLSRTGAVPPTFLTNNDGSTRTFNHALYIIAFEEIATYLAQNRSQSTDQALLNSILSLFPKFIALLQAQDDHDLSTLPPPEKNPNVQLKKTVSTLISIISPLFAQDVSKSLTMADSATLFQCFVANLHHPHEPVAHSTAAALGLLIHLFPQKYKTTAIDLLLQRFHDAAIVPQLKHPAVPRANYPDDIRQTGQSNNPAVINPFSTPFNTPNNDNGHVYEHGKLELNTTQLYLLSFSSLAQVTDFTTLSTSITPLISTLIHSLPTALLTAQIFKKSDQTTSGFGVEIDQAAVKAMNTTIANLSPNECSLYISIIISLQSLLNKYFQIINSPEHTTNTLLNFTAPQIDSQIDTLLSTASPEGQHAAQHTFQPENVENSLFVQLPPDLCYLLQRVLSNCLLIDPLFNYRSEPPNGDFTPFHRVTKGSNSPTSKMNNDFDDDFASDDDTPAKLASAVNYDDDFASDDDGMGGGGGGDDDDDDGDDSGNAGATSNTYVVVLDSDDENYAYSGVTVDNAFDDDFNDDKDETMTLSSNPEKGAQLRDYRQRKHSFEVISGDKTQTIRSIALNLLVQFMTTTMMSLRQYSSPNKSNSEACQGGVITNIPPNTPLAILLLNTPIWMATINFALREHDPVQMGEILSALPFIFTHLSYIYTVLNQQHSQSNPLPYLMSDNKIDIATMMINYVNAALSVSVTQDGVENTQFGQNVNPHKDHLSHVLSIWSLQSSPSDAFTALDFETQSQQLTYQLAQNNHSPCSTRVAISTHTDLSAYLSAAITFTPALFTKYIISTLTTLTTHLPSLLSTLINTSPALISGQSNNTVLSTDHDLLITLFRSVTALVHFLGNFADILQPSVTFTGDLRFFITKPTGNNDTDALFFTLQSTYNSFIISVLSTLLPYMLYHSELVLARYAPIWSAFTFLFKSLTATALFTNHTLPQITHNQLINLYNKQSQLSTKGNINSHIAAIKDDNTVFVSLTLFILYSWYTNPTTPTSILHYSSHILQHLIFLASTTHGNTINNPTFEQVYPDIVTYPISDQINSIMLAISQTMLTSYQTTALQLQQQFNLSILHHVLTLLPSASLPSIPALLNAPFQTAPQTGAKFTLLYLALFSVAQSLYIFAETSTTLRLLNAPSVNVALTTQSSGQSNTIGLGTNSDLAATTTSTGFLSSTLTAQPSATPAGMTYGDAAKGRVLRKRQRVIVNGVFVGSKNDPLGSVLPSWIDGLPGVYYKNIHLYKDIVKASTLKQFPDCKSNSSSTPPKGRGQSKTRKPQNKTASKTMDENDGESDQDDEQSPSSDLLAPGSDSFTDHRAISSGHIYDVAAGGQHQPRSRFDHYNVAHANTYDYLLDLHPHCNPIQFCYDLVKFINLASTQIDPHFFKLAFLFTTLNANYYYNTLINLFTALFTITQHNTAVLQHLRNAILTSINYLTLPYNQTTVSTPQSGDSLLTQTLNNFAQDLNIAAQSTILTTPSLASSLQHQLAALSTSPTPTLAVTQSVYYLPPNAVTPYLTQFSQQLQTDQIALISFPSLLPSLISNLATYIQSLPRVLDSGLFLRSDMSDVTSSSPIHHSAPPITTSTLPHYLTLIYSILQYYPHNHLSYPVVNDLYHLISIAYLYTEHPLSISPLFSSLFSQLTHCLIALEQTAQTALIDLTPSTITHIALPTIHHTITTLFQFSQKTTSSDEFPLDLYQRIAFFFISTASIVPLHKATVQSHQTLINQLLLALDELLAVVHNATNINSIEFSPQTHPLFMHSLSTHQIDPTGTSGPQSIYINGTHLLHLTLATFTVFPTSLFVACPLNIPIAIKSASILTQFLGQNGLTGQNHLLTKLTTAFISLFLFAPTSPIADVTFSTWVYNTVTELAKQAQQLVSSSSSNSDSQSVDFRIQIFINSIATTMSTYSYINTVLPQHILAKSIYSASTFFTDFINPLSTATPVTPVSPALLILLSTLTTAQFFKAVQHNAHGDFSPLKDINEEKSIDDLCASILSFDSLSTQIMHVISPEVFTAWFTHNFSTYAQNPAHFNTIQCKSFWMTVLSLMRGANVCATIYNTVLTSLLTTSSLSTYQKALINAMLSRTKSLFAPIFTQFEQMSRDKAAQNNTIPKLAVKSELALLFTTILRSDISLLTPSVSALLTTLPKHLDLEVNRNAVDVHATPLNNLFAFFSINSTLSPTQIAQFTIPSQSRTIGVHKSTVADMMNAISKRYPTAQIYLNPADMNTAILAHLVSLTKNKYSTSSLVNTLPSTLFSPTLPSTFPYTTSSSLFIFQPRNYIIHFVNLLSTSDGPTYLSSYTSSKSVQFQLQTSESQSAPFPAILSNLLQTPLTSISNPNAHLSPILSVLAETNAGHQMEKLLISLGGEMCIRKEYCQKIEQGKSFKYLDDCLPLRLNAVELLTKLITHPFSRGYKGFVNVYSQYNTATKKFTVTCPLLNALLFGMEEFDINHSFAIRTSTFSLLEKIITSQNIPTLPYMPSVTYTLGLTTNTFHYDVELLKVARKPASAASASAAAAASPTMTDEPTSPASQQSPNNKSNQSDDAKDADKHKIVFPNINPPALYTTGVVTTSAQTSSQSTQGSAQTQSTSQIAAELNTLVAIFQPTLHDACLDRTLIHHCSHLIATKLKEYMIVAHRLKEHLLHQYCASVQIALYLSQLPLIDNAFKLSTQWHTLSIDEKKLNKSTADNQSITRFFEQTVLGTEMAENLLIASVYQRLLDPETQQHELH